MEHLPIIIIVPSIKPYKPALASASMAMITKIEPQYAPQGHILSLKVDVKNEKIEQTLVKIAISVSNGKKASDSDGNVPARFTDVIIPAQQVLTVDLLLNEPVLPAEEAIKLTVFLSQQKPFGSIKS